MPRTRIKICGIKTVEAALAAAAAGADAIGLVFVKKSPRCVSVEQAKQIVANLPAWVTPVGLFVDERVERVREIAAAVGLRSVQLHGSETVEDAAALSSLSVTKAVGAGADLGAWMKVHALLIDTPGEGGELGGGSGRVYDWSRLVIPEDAPPIVLAGGLTSENVGEAIREVRPFGVDVSSGVESERGVKSNALIAGFCGAVRRADAVG